MKEKQCLNFEGKTTPILNLLILSPGKHGHLIKVLRKELSKYCEINIITAGNNELVAGYAVGDKSYLLPNITDNTYLELVSEIIVKENIHGVFTMLDEETVLLEANNDLFNGTILFSSVKNSSHICYDKYEFHRYLEINNIPTIKTKLLANVDFKRNLGKKIIKPRRGKGSIGVTVVDDINTIDSKMLMDNTLICQEYINGEEIDVDAYIDVKSGKLVDYYSKKKLSMSLGGATALTTYYDPQIEDIIIQLASIFDFRGPINIDLFKTEKGYLVTEVNARFGAGYVHTSLAGHGFGEYIFLNLLNKENNVNLRMNNKTDIVTTVKDNYYLIK